MLSEYLHSTDPSIQAEWHPVMPGVQVCRFETSQPASGFPVSLPLHLDPMHFEALFCRGGALLAERKRGTPLTVSSRDILLLSDSSFLRSVRMAAPLEGILVSVDGARASESLTTLYRLLGDLQSYAEQMKSLLGQQNGCILLRESPWSRSVFAALEELPAEEHSRYSALKVMELMYLLCIQSSLLDIGTENNAPDNYLTRTVADMRTYMENRLDEKLTIESMSRRFHIAPTAFKSCFRRLYGQPVHNWLQAQRLKKAADYLYSTPMTVLQIAQAVGYEGVSQFNVAFKHRYGVTPGQYRKMSNNGEF